METITIYFPEGKCSYTLGKEISIDGIKSIIAQIKIAEPSDGNDYAMVKLADNRLFVVSGFPYVFFTDLTQST